MIGDTSGHHDCNCDKWSQRLITDDTHARFNFCIYCLLFLGNCCFQRKGGAIIEGKIMWTVSFTRYCTAISTEVNVPHSPLFNVVADKMSI